MTEPRGSLDRRRPARPAVIVTAGLLGLALGLLIPGVRSRTSPVARLDARVTNRLHGFALDHPAYTETMRVISDIGAVVWWLVLIPLAITLAVRRQNRAALFVAVAGAGSPLLNRVIKDLVDRPRPVLVDPVARAAGRSFPSGHTQAAVVGVAILLVLFLPLFRRARRPIAVLGGVVVVALIGFSRIALGVHFLSDVVGAVIVGVLWVVLVASACSIGTDRPVLRRTPDG